MTDGKVIIIRGQVTGDLAFEEHFLDGEAEALILHLDHAEQQPGYQKIRPIGDVMNIRSEPRIANNIIGKLDQETEAIEEHYIDTANVWVRIGFRQYVALIYGGTIYCRYV